MGREPIAFSHVSFRAHAEIFGNHHKVVLELEIIRHPPLGYDFPYNINDLLFSIRKNRSDLFADCSGAVDDFIKMLGAQTFDHALNVKITVVRIATHLKFEKLLEM